MCTCNDRKAYILLFGRNCCSWDLTVRKSSDNNSLTYCFVWSPSFFSYVCNTQNWTSLRKSSLLILLYIWFLAFCPCGIIGDDQRTRRRSNDSRRTFRQQRAVWFSVPGHHQTHQGTPANHATSSPVTTPRGNVLAPPENVRIVFAVCKTGRVYRVQGTVWRSVEKVQVWLNGNET